MRKDSRQLRLARKKKSARWFFRALVAAGFGLLGWLWWQQRVQVPPLLQSARTNDLPRAIYRSSKVDRSSMSSNVPVVRMVARPATNINEVWPKMALSNGQASSASLTGYAGPTPNLLSRTNAQGGLEPMTSGRLSKDILEVQIALARQAISSGCIDGKYGPQTRAALRAFQAREHIPLSGEPDANTKARLTLDEPAFTTYTISPNDLAQLTVVGSTWLEKSQQERLDYESLLELVAEKGHAHESLIRSLNRGIDWTNIVAGTAVTIPNVRYPASGAKAAFVRIRLAEKSLQAFDAGTNLLAHFPCSIARLVGKRPLGQLLVERLAMNPNYRFDPDVFPESAEGRVLIIPPGPNNPVGSAWIGLNRPGYGIHGTSRPEAVGRTESHGCFRLANWNAEYLLQLVTVGTPVIVEP